MIIASIRGPRGPQEYLCPLLHLRVKIEWMFRFVSAVGSPVVNISAPSTPNITSQAGARYSDRTNKGK